MAIFVPIYAETDSAKFDDNIIGKTVGQMNEIDGDSTEEYTDRFDYVHGLWFNYHNTENYAHARNDINERCFVYGTGFVYTVVDKQFLLNCIENMMLDEPREKEAYDKINSHPSMNFLINFIP